MSEDRNPVDLLAEEFASRFRQGEHPSVAEYAERYPQHAAEIEELFPSIVMMEQLKRRDEQDRETLERRGRVGGRLLERLGDYEIVREIGRGGMGVVFEAVQSSLGRRVALKVLSDAAMASQRHLQRFDREARAAAALHHTNIVPVFGVGHEDGLHFYVMQYIHGVGLDEILAALKEYAHEPAGGDDTTASFHGHHSALQLAEALRCGSFAAEAPSYSSHSMAARETRAGQSDHSTLDVDRPDWDAAAGMTESTVRAATSTDQFGPQYWKSVARIGFQVADSLEYAHAQGVLHRDIKPGNLLLDPQGTVWVTDFGLAKVTENQDLTNTGDIVGTLRYMAPEQFDGRSDARSDIYSLGLTLYELLTLRPACDDTAIKQLVEHRTNESMVRPRAINPQVPRDLETIVLKAISADPAHRYQTAAAFSEDLQRFLEDRPILARRVTAAERIWRWSRRNPAVAALTFMATALVFVVLLVLSAAHLRVRQERNRVADANQRAEQNLKLALEAFEHIVENLGARGLPPDYDLGLDAEEQPLQYESVVSPADVELLEQLLEFFGRFAVENSADLHQETANAHRRVGDIQFRLKQYEAAGRAYERALRLYEELSREAPSASHVIARAEILRDLARVKRRQIGRVARSDGSDAARDMMIEASRLIHAAQELLQNQPVALRRLPEMRFALAQSYLALGNPFVNPEPRYAKRGPGDRRRDRPRPGGPPRRRGEGPDRTWSDATRNAEKLLLGLLAEDPENPRYRLAMADCLKSRAYRLRRHDSELARARWQEAVKLLEDLHRDHPNEIRYRTELASSLVNASLFAGRDRADADVAQLEQARAILEDVTRQFPSVAEYHFVLATCLESLARTKSDEDAIALLRQAISEMEQGVDAEDSPWYRARWQHTHLRLAGVLLNLGRYQEARKVLDAVRPEFRAMLESPGRVHTRMLRRSAVDFFRHLLRVSEQLDDHDTARQARLVLEKLGNPPGRPAPSNP